MLLLSLAHTYPGIANLTVSSLHLLKLVGTYHSQRCGVENSFFLLHQVEDILNDHLLHLDELLILILLYETACIAYLVTDEVIEEPHRRCWAVETLLL